MTTYPADPRLEARGLSKSYGGRRVVQDFSLAIGPGETVALLGKSGVGKTTVMAMMAGTVPPDSGQVWLNGEDITGRVGRLGYMQQKDLLLPYKRVIDNVALPLVLAGEKKRAAREKAGALFETFGLAGCELLYPSQLSGGMRQRAALLRTTFLCRDAALLDEPFSALDAMTKTDMHAWFLGLSSGMNLSTLFITHDINEAVALSGRVVVLAGSPARVAAEFPILPEHRAQPDFTLSGAFLEYKRKILDVL